MFKKSSIWLLALIMVFGLLAGCGTSTQDTPPEKPAKTSSQANYPLAIKDDSGSEVTIPAQPQRIISFVPSTTETLFALGLEGKVVAVTKWDNYPEGVQQKVEYIFEDSLHPNTEQILNLNPDLIILGMHDEKTITAIKNLKLPVVIFNPQNLESTYQTIEKLAKITNKAEQGTKIVQAMKAKENQIEEKIASIKPEDRRRVWLEVDSNLFTAGNGTFLDELLTKAGGINIAHEINDWAQFSEEKIIAKNPQVILDTYSYYVKDASQQILSRPNWQNIDAIKDKHVIDLNSDMVTRPGPRIIDGLESMAKAIYPELFK